LYLGAVSGPEGIEVGTWSGDFSGLTRGSGSAVGASRVAVGIGVWWGRAVDVVGGTRVELGVG
jgi:hypothetical protein